MSTYTAFPATPEPKQYFPDSAPAEVKAVVRWLDKVYSVQWMGDMASALKRLVPDVDWTLPFIEFHSAASMRTWYYLLHYITYEVFEPSFVEVSPLTGQDRTLVNVHGTLTFRPKRSLLVPPSLLLPEAIPVSGQWRVGIKGPLTTGKVEFVRITFNNLPNLPSLVRNAAGMLQGGVFALTEGLWGPVAALLGDDYYQANQGPTSGLAAGGQGLLSSAQGAAAQVQQQVAGVAGQAFDKVLGTTAVNTSKAYQTVVNAATGGRAPGAQAAQATA